MLGYFNIGQATFRGVLNFFRPMLYIYTLRSFLRYSNLALSYIQYTDQQIHSIQ